jgi:hypothetical protein
LITDPVTVNPLDMQAQSVRHETLVRMVVFAPAGFGGATMCQDWPSKVRAWETVAVAPELGAAPTAVHEVALKQLMP